eukprot:gene12584-14870_t
MTANFVSTKIAAKELGVTARVLRDWDEKGKIATCRTSGNMRLYDIDGYLKQMKDQSNAIVSTTQTTSHVLTEAWKLDIETMFKLIHDKPITDDPFVVNFDRAYNWIGFANKRNAKRHLIKNFDNGIDFSITDPDVPQTELIMLSADCFKSMCMTANTAQGKLVRKYYIELERNLRDGYLPLAGQVVQNYDAKNNVETEVLLKTTENGADGAPTWVNLRKIFTERFCKLLTPIEAPNSDDVRLIAREVHDYVERFASEMEMNTYMPTTDDRGRKVPWGKRVREIEGRQRRVLRKRPPKDVIA